MPGANRLYIARSKRGAGVPGGLAFGPNLISSPNGPFASGNWTASNVTETTGQTDPLGGTTASLLTDTVTNAQHFVQNGGSFTAAAGTKYLFTYYVKPGTYPNKTSCWSIPGANAFLEFDNTAHTASDGGGILTFSNLTSTSVANGFWKVTGTVIASASGAAGFLIGFNTQLGAYAGTLQTFTLWGVSVQAQISS